MFSSEDDDRREFLKICGKSVATDHYPVALELAPVNAIRCVWRHGCEGRWDGAPSS